MNNSYKLRGGEMLCSVEYVYSASGEPDRRELVIDNYTVPLDQIENSAENYVSECLKVYGGDFSSEWWEDHKDIDSVEVRVIAYDEDKEGYVKIDSTHVYNDL